MDESKGERARSDAEGEGIAEQVKAAMQHAWGSYEKRCFGSDELLPQSGRGQENWGGLGVTLVDSLDTLWIMGMHKEFQRARDWVATRLSFRRPGKTVSVFETTIRDLGGLLSAHSLTGDTVFLTKACELADRLLHAFDNGLFPTGQIVLDPPRANNGGQRNLAEVGTLQLELRYLSHATGESKYRAKGDAVHDHFYEMFKSGSSDHGLFPLYLSSTGRPAGGKLSFGAMGDSYYEYLLKVWKWNRESPEDSHLKVTN
jgi:mannosyl-oligosaccharide alpha-1,2-mannosidase